MRRSVWESLILIGLAACAAPPEQGLSPSSPGSAELDLAERAGARAALASRQARWADSVEWREIAALAAPSAETRAALEAARARASEAAANAWRSAQDWRRRGELDRAQADYLAVLVADRQHAGALAALRELERERVARAYYLRPPRGGPAMVYPESPSKPNRTPSAGAD